MLILGLGPADAHAVSADGARWALIGLPDEPVTALQSHEALRPRPGQPASIVAAVLTDARPAQLAALSALAALGPLDVHATPHVFETLTAAPLAEGPCRHGCVRWHLLPLAGDCRHVDFQIVGLPALHFTAAIEDADGSERLVVAVTDLHDGDRALLVPEAALAAAAR